MKQEELQQEEPSFTAYHSLKRRPKLNYDDECDLQADIAVVQQMLECIAYVSSEAAHNGDRKMSDNEQYAKWDYAKYNVACNATFFLSSYAQEYTERLQDTIGGVEK